MTIPLLDLGPSHKPLYAEFHAAFDRVLTTGRFIMGPEVEMFEREIAEVVGVRHAIAMSSGSDALLAALMALKVAPGDEVITTPYSFFATAGCIARLRATPVFVDVQPDTLNIDVDHVARAITPKTKAIIPIHLFGLPADLEELRELARRHDIVLVEDACQAIGATYRGASIGAIGDMATFSFFPSKNLGGFGDGGLLTTNSDDLARLVRMIRTHGSEKKYHHEIVGANFRLDALQAALLRVKLPHLDGWAAARKANADRYRVLFAAAGLDEIMLPPEPRDRTHVYHQFVIRAPHRDALRASLGESGIGTEVYYPVPLHLQPCFADLGYGKGDFPHAERAAHEVLALPMFPGLTESQQERVVGAIRAFVHTSGVTRPSAVS
jgi:dTDP-4-amino-4,6-dideoxygalactose transaminase